MGVCKSATLSNPHFTEFTSACIVQSYNGGVHPLSKPSDWRKWRLSHFQFHRLGFARAVSGTKEPITGPKLANSGCEFMPRSSPQRVVETPSGAWKDADSIWKVGRCPSWSNLTCKLSEFIFEYTSPSLLRIQFSLECSS